MRGKRRIRSLIFVVVAGGCLLASSRAARAQGVDVAPMGTASQSTDYSPSFTADRAIDGDFNTFTATAGGDTAGSWELDLGKEYGLSSIVLHNRRGCCPSRLRDIAVSVLNDGGEIVFESGILNEENELGGGMLNVGPDDLTVDLEEETGAVVPGRFVRVGRTADPDLSGSGGQGGNDEANILSLSEVQVFSTDDDIPPSIIEQPVGGLVTEGDSIVLSVVATGSEPIEYQWRKDDEDIPGEEESTLELLDLTVEDSGVYRVVVTNGAGSATSEPAEVLVTGENLALSGLASQSSNWNASLTADKAVDGNLSTFTATATADAAATWEVDLTDIYELGLIVLQNRRDCCASRLRDITVTVLDEGGEVVFESGLLNEENELGGGRLNVGPSMLIVDLVAETGEPVEGQIVRVTRMPDPDRSGSGGQGNADEPNVLSLAEVQVFEAVGTVPRPPLFRRGDVDANGSFTIGDAILLLDHLFADKPAPSCRDAADIDDSGSFTIGDAISLLNYLFSDGPPPLSPGPDTCGPDPQDPTPSDLDCVSFPPCK